MWGNMVITVSMFTSFILMLLAVVSYLKKNKRAGKQRFLGSLGLFVFTFVFTFFVTLSYVPSETEPSASLTPIPSPAETAPSN